MIIERDWIIYIYRYTETKSFLEKVFAGSIGSMVYKFVNEGELSKDEFKRLKEMLNSIDKED